jgi:branched-chain amino acid aminotransferase
VLLDQRGFIAETNATNLFAVLVGTLVTPTSVACPEGITRATVLRLASEAGIPAEVRDISLAELYAADEAFCTGTMGEIAGVVCVDGRSIGAGAVGPITQAITARYRTHVRSGGVQLID